MPQFTTSAFIPDYKGAAPWISILKPDESLLSCILDTPENRVLIEIMVNALNAAYDNPTPVNETPVNYIEYETV